MEELSLDDLKNYTVEVHPVEFLGKQGYIRSLTLAGQEAISKRYAGKENDEASISDIVYMVTLLLCNSKGDLIFETPEQGTEILSKLPSVDLMELIDIANKINGADVEHEKKLSAVT